MLGYRNETLVSTFEEHNRLMWRRIQKQVGLVQWTRCGVGGVERMVIALAWEGCAACSRQGWEGILHKARINCRDKDEAQTREKFIFLSQNIPGKPWLQELIQGPRLTG